MKRGVLLALTLLLVAAVAFAQMPDVRQMSGMPLPVGDVPVGTVTVRVIRGQLTNPLVGESVELSGPGTAAKTAKTDQSGRAQFSGLAPGTRVKAAATINGEKLESQEFDVPAQGGIRLMLVATDPDAAKRDAEDHKAAQAAAVPGSVVLGQESRLVIEVGDDGLNVFNILQIVNGARTPVQTSSPLVITLPPDARGAGMLEGSAPNAVAGKGTITVNGPFRPGNTVVQFAYSLPFGADTMTIRQSMPAPMTQVTIVAQKVGNMHMSSPQVTQHRETAAEGQAYVLGQGPALKAGDTITITLTGLPHEARWPRYLALALVVGILLGGAVLARGKGAGTDDEARRRKLHAERDRLMGQLAALEEQHRQHAIDEDRYASRRHELLASLERVYEQLDEGVAA